MCKCYKGNVKMNFFISLFTENKLLHSFNVCGARFQTLAASILNVASSIAERLDSTKVVTFIDLVVLASSAGGGFTSHCSHGRWTGLRPLNRLPPIH